jgi:peptidoglycan/xylan/chitin deacetylase (PgdA/CDA1 family)
MSSDELWLPLAAELERWKAAGRSADFWLRDDDAVEPTAPLDRLLALTGDFGIPVTLAVIPAFTDEALVRRLALAPHAAVAVHGWSHRNYAPEGRKRQELGSHRPRGVVLDELSRGLSHLTRLHGDRAIPMLVPPWNRIDAGLLPDLRAIGFTALSVYGPAKPAPLSVINTNVDLMDWHGTRGCRDHGALVRDIVGELDRSFASGEPVGLLTHHLVHDEAAWAFLNGLFEVTAGRACHWHSARELIGQR